MKQPTIKTVAARAGTSIATVSRVIHGNYPVSDELKRRINQVIAETGYRPNAIAASIRTRRTMTVGMIVSKFNNPLLMQTVLGVESILESQGYQLIISSSNNELSRERKIIDSLHERMVDALVAVSVSKDDSIFKRFLDHDIPVVIVDRRIPSERLDMVLNDDCAAMHKLTDHVISRGHTSIALLKGIDEIVIGRDRAQGFRDAMKASGLPVNETFVLEGAFTRDRAYEQVRDLLGRTEGEGRPTAIVACNTLMAEGAMQAIYEHGMRIPHDISLACYGVLSRSPVFRPRIVCMDQRSEEIGIAAGKLVLERMRGVQRAPEHTIVEATFIDGDSVRKLSEKR